VATSASINDHPSAFRYPRGNGTGIALPEQAQVLEIGKGRIIRTGKKVAILSLGTRLQEAMKALDELEKHGISVTVADARFAKPIDEELVAKLLNEHELLITIEEGSCGGFGSHILEFASKINSETPIKNLCLPDEFIEQGTVADLYEQAGLNASGIVAEVLEIMTDVISAPIVSIAQ